MEAPLAMETPGVNLLFSKLSSGSDVITRDVLVELVTKYSPDQPTQIEPIVERIAELVGADHVGSISLHELDSAFQQPSLKDFLRHLFGSPETELFAAHTSGNPTLARARVEQLVTDKGQGENLGLLLAAMGNPADTDVSEDGFTAACDAYPSLMLACFGDIVPGLPASLETDAGNQPEARSAAASVPSPITPYGSRRGLQSTPLPGPGRPRSFTREESFISEVEDNELWSPVARSPLSSLTASRSHSDGGYSSTAAAAAARARVAGMAPPRDTQARRMPADDSGVFSSPEPGDRSSYASPYADSDEGSFRPRAGTLHRDTTDQDPRDAGSELSELDRPASRQSSRFSENGRYNSDTKQRALESLFEAANTTETDRIGANELYTFLQNPGISGKAGTEMASMFGMLPKSFFAAMFQTIDTDFGADGLHGGLDKQGFAEAFSDMFDENGNYYIPTDAVGSQLRALFVEYKELVHETDETKLGHERELQQQLYELKRGQDLRTHLETHQVYDAGRIEQLEAEAEQSRLENVELRSKYEEQQAQVADMHRVQQEIDEHRATLEQLAQDNQKLRQQSKKDGELEATLARVQSKYEDELTALADQLGAIKGAQEETTQEYVKYVEAHPSRPVSRKTTPGNSQSKLEPMETGGDRVRDLELTRSLIRDGLETLLYVVETVTDGSDVAWTGGLIDTIDANLEIGEDCRTMLMDVETLMKTLMSMAFKLARKARDATAEAVAESKEQIEDLVSQIGALKTEVSRLQALDTDATGVRSALALLMKKHERLKADLADSVPASTLADVERLKAELAASVPAAVLADVQRQLAEAQRQLGEVEQQLQSSEDEKDTVKVSLTLNTAAQKRAEQALLVLQCDFDDLLQRCDASEAARQRLQAENDALCQERASLQEAATKLEHDLQDAAAEHRALSRALDASHNVGDTASAQVRDLQERLASAQAANEATNVNLTRDAAAAECEIAALKQQLAAANEATETVRGSLTMKGAALDEQIQDLRDRLAEANRITETIRVTLTMTTAAAEREVEELKDALAAATKNAATIQVSLTLNTAAAERQLAQAHRRLEAVTQDLDTARGQLVSERNDRHNLEVKLAQVGSELQLAQNRLAAAEASLEARATATPTDSRSELGDIFDRMEQLQAGMDTAKLKTRRRSKDAQASAECSIRDLQAQLCAVKADLARERAAAKAGAIRVRTDAAEDPSVLRASLLATRHRLELSERHAEELALTKGELVERLAQLESVHGTELRRKDGRMSKQAHELETQQHLLSRRNIQIAALGSRVAALEGKLAALLQEQRERDLADAAAAELAQREAEAAAIVQVGRSLAADSDAYSDVESGTESGTDGLDDPGCLDGDEPAVAPQAPQQHRQGVFASDAALIKAVEDLLDQGELGLDLGLEQRVDSLTRENLKLWEVVKSVVYSGALPTSKQRKSPATTAAAQSISTRFENLVVVAVDSKLDTTPTLPKRINIELTDGHVSVLRSSGDFIARWRFRDVARVLVRDRSEGRCVLELGNHAGVTIDLDVGRRAGSFVDSIRAKMNKSYA